MSSKGVDVSNYQGVINFAKVKASGIEIVYIKATEGISYINPLLLSQHAGALSAGLRIGFYHYLGTNNPIAEAEHFLNTTSSFAVDCKHVIDIEGTWSVAEASSSVRTFANYLISKGKEVAIYTGDYFYKNNLNSTVKDLPLWIAAYSNTNPIPTSVGWQYSSSGSVEGVSGNVDVDLFEDGMLLSTTVTDLQIQQMLNKLGYKGLNGLALTEDGNLGVNSIFAIKAFQKHDNLVVDGEVGALTLTALKNDIAKLVVPVVPVIKPIVVVPIVPVVKPVVPVTPVVPVVVPIIPVVKPIIDEKFTIRMTANIENIGVVSVDGINICNIGTQGKSLRLEMFSMVIDGIEFTYFISEEGLQNLPPQVSGSVLGSIGVSKRIEGIQINVTSIPVGYKLQYRAHIQNLGETGWVDSGVFCGTVGMSLRIEEIEVQVIKC